MSTFVTISNAISIKKLSTRNCHQCTGFVTNITVTKKTLNSHGPAEKSGVKPNDVIIRINGIETHSLRKRTIGSLIERFRVHVTIECIEDQDLENFCHSKIDSYKQDRVIKPKDGRSLKWAVIGERGR